ncbi:MAG TPA: patatin family protein [Leptospiraceae bacterium]|nr:patatin family protein [Leptospiraceae bacterium]HMY66553.1 patatin family protein [Leptospiraceae bacterium]HNF14636.1 patatin family protein [Leptospiraceae bacterium]HNI96114.1 patatin family protein [Leptospiraceae bacterium]HNM05135.1 patatin family protein [Leptospiraceae bacterium]
MDLPKAKKKNSTALIVEGGGMRGAFAGGALSAMCKYYPSKNFDLMLGVSAGSCSLAYYATEDRRSFPSLKKILEIWQNELHGSRFISFKNLLRGSTILNQKYLIDYLIADKHRINIEKFKRKLKIPFYIAVSNLENIKAEYIKVNHENIFQVLKAATALPIATKGRHLLNQIRYSDGGITDPIPIKAVIEAGYKNITLVLNHPRDYFSKPLHRLMAYLSFPFHRSVRKFLKEEHHEKYNEAKRIIQNPPEGVNLEIIDPEKKIPVKITTTRQKDVIALFEHGWERAEKFFKRK